MYWFAKWVLGGWTLEGASSVGETAVGGSSHASGMEAALGVTKVMLGNPLCGFPRV